MCIEAFIHETVARHGTCREKLLPILQDIVAKKRFLEPEDIQILAEKMGISSADIYGTASFYSFLDIVPRGKNIIRVCKTISCDLKEKSNIIATLENHLHIKVGQTTNDNRFSLLETNCLGHCHEGPVMLVNDDIYTSLNASQIPGILEKYSK